MRCTLEVQKGYKITLGIILLISGLVLVFLMRKAPTAAAIALIPLAAPGLIWIGLSSFGAMPTSTKTNFFLLIISLFVLHAIYLSLKYLLKRFFN